MSTVSEVLICNLALIKIGEQRINSLSDTTKAAKICNEIFGVIRDEVLEAHPWNFALKRAAFSQLTSTPAYGYTYEYQIPSDCLRIWNAENDRCEYKIEDGKVLTNESTFSCQYIYKLTNVTKFSRTFVNAFSLRLAAELSYSITGSREVQDTMMKLYLEALRVARFNDAQEGTPDEVIQTNYLESRY